MRVRGVYERDIDRDRTEACGLGPTAFGRFHMGSSVRNGLAFACRAVQPDRPDEPATTSSSPSGRGTYGGPAGSASGSDGSEGRSDVAVAEPDAADTAASANERER